MADRRLILGAVCSCYFCLHSCTNKTHFYFCSGKSTVTFSPVRTNWLSPCKLSQTRAFIFRPRLGDFFPDYIPTAQINRLNCGTKMWDEYYCVWWININTVGLHFSLKHTMALCLSKLRLSALREGIKLEVNMSEEPQWAPVLEHLTMQQDWVSALECKVSATPVVRDWRHQLRITSSANDGYLWI